MPPDPHGAFLVSQSALDLFCRKNTPKKMWKFRPPFKISRYAAESSNRRSVKKSGYEIVKSYLRQAQIN